MKKILLLAIGVACFHMETSANETFHYQLDWGGLCTPIDQIRVYRSVDGGAFGLFQTLTTTADFTSTSAASEIVSTSGTTGQTVDFRVDYRDTVLNVTNSYSFGWVSSRGSDVGTFHEYSGGGINNCGGTNQWCIKVTLRNDDTSQHGYVFVKNSQVFCLDSLGGEPPGEGNWLILQAGQTGTMKMCGLDSTNGISVRQLGTYNRDWYIGGTEGCQFPVDGGGNQTSGTALNPSPGLNGKLNSGEPTGNPVVGVSGGSSNSGTNTAPNYATNGPINFGASSTNLATESTLKQGFNTLYDSQEKIRKAIVDETITLGNKSDAIKTEIANGTSSTGGKLDAIKSAIEGLSFTNSGPSSISNYVAVTLTNTGAFGTNGSGYETGIVAAVSGFHTDNTNWLGSIHGKLGWLTNLSFLGGTNSYPSDGTFTNAASAMAQGSSESAEAVEGIDNAIAELGSAPTPISGGGAPSMVIPFMNTSIDISPDAIAPGVTSWIYGMLSFVTLVMFGKSASRLLFQTSQTYATAQTGGVPNMGSDVPVVGNSIGLATAFLIPIALIAIWMVVFAAIIPLVTSFLTQLATSSGALTPSNALALSLLSSVFPLNLIINCAWTLIVLHLMATKVIIVSASASRFLFGK